MFLLKDICFDYTKAEIISILYEIGNVNQVLSKKAGLAGILGGINQAKENTFSKIISAKESKTVEKNEVMKPVKKVK